MTEISAKLKFVILLLLFVVSMPLIILGIVNLVVISAANIWGWMFIGFGAISLTLVSILLITLKGTTSSRYDAVFEIE
jgi:hypothetical protein